MKRKEIVAALDAITDEMDALKPESEVPGVGLMQDMGIVSEREVDMLRWGYIIGSTDAIGLLTGELEYCGDPHGWAAASVAGGIMTIVGRVVNADA